MGSMLNDVVWVLLYYIVSAKKLVSVRAHYSKLSLSLCLCHLEIHNGVFVTFSVRIIVYHAVNLPERTVWLQHYRYKSKQRYMPLD